MAKLRLVVGGPVDGQRRRQPKSGLAGKHISLELHPHNPIRLDQVEGQTLEQKWAGIVSHNPAATLEYVIHFWSPTAQQWNYAFTLRSTPLLIATDIRQHPQAVAYMAQGPAPHRGSRLKAPPPTFRRRFFPRSMNPAA